MTGEVIYPHRPDLHKKKFWRCRPCDAYVGCHGATYEPLGILANPELRLLRRKAHDAFDVRWEGKGKGVRNSCYKALAETLGIDKNECHIGQFDIEMCRRVIKATTRGEEGR